MKRWAIGGALAALLAATAAGIASSQAPGEERPLADYFFGPRLARAEFVMVLGAGEVHDFRVDQGRVLGSRGGVLGLLERDGTRQLVPVGPRTRVTINGVPGTLAEIQRGMFALTVRDGAQPAQVVRVTARRAPASGER